jgi:hypothetical protein
VFREYLMATMTVRTDAAFDALAINIAGTEIGEHTIRLVAADGRVVWSTTYTRTNADPATMHINADCSSVANGVYVVQFEHPMGNQSTPIVLIR